MQLKKLVPLVTVKSLAEVKDFYTTHFGFSPTMESDAYLGLAAKGGAEIAFMKQDTCAPATFSGEGLTLCRQSPTTDFGTRQWLAGGLVGILKNQGKLAEAEALYRETIEVGRKSNNPHELAGTLAMPLNVIAVILGGGLVVIGLWLMVLTVSSTFLEISVSISSGEAPGLAMITMTVGISTFGKRSTPSEK